MQMGNDQAGSGRNEFARAEARPLALFHHEAVTANHVILKAKFVLLNNAIALDPHHRRLDIGVNGGVHGFKVGGFGQVGLLVLGFNRVIGDAAVNVKAIYTNAHRDNPPSQGKPSFLLMYLKF